MVPIASLFRIQLVKYEQDLRPLGRRSTTTKPGAVRQWRTGVNVNPVSINLIAAVLGDETASLRQQYEIFCQRQ
jgi:hypothetical protein